MFVNGKDIDAISRVYGPADNPILSSLTTALAVPGSSDSIEVQCYAAQRAIEPKRCRALIDSFRSTKRGDSLKLSLDSNR